MSNFQVGDRVEAVSARGFCDCNLGRKFIIGNIDGETGHLTCTKCRRVRHVTWCAQELGYRGFIGWVAFEQLRKLPPLAEPESLERTTDEPQGETA